MENFSFMLLNNLVVTKEINGIVKGLKEAFLLQKEGFKITSLAELREDCIYIENHLDKNLCSIVYEPSEFKGEHKIVLETTHSSHGILSEYLLSIRYTLKNNDLTQKVINDSMTVINKFLDKYINSNQNITDTNRNNIVSLYKLAHAEVNAILKNTYKNNSIPKLISNIDRNEEIHNDLKIKLKLSLENIYDERVSGKYNDEKIIKMLNNMIVGAKDKMKNHSVFNEEVVLETSAFLFYLTKLKEIIKY